MKLGAYTLIKKIAQGGVADIYLAKARTIVGQDKYLVCKCIRDSLSGDVEFLTSIMNEIQFSTRLHHPNIIDIFDFCSCDGKAFLVMEYMDANNFHHLLKKNAELWDKVPPDIAIYAIGQAALGLHAAHEMTDDAGNPLQLVHRDISPENILFASDGSIKISDFGIAKTCKMPDITGIDVVKGKFNYMSPEQAWADKTDRRSDLYSLAIVLYEALLGVQFNPGEDIDEALNRARMAVFELPHNIDPDFPEDLEKILLKAFDLDKKLRYSTVLEFKQALDECAKAHHWHADVKDWIRYLQTHTDFPDHPLPLLHAGEIQPDSTSVLKPALENNPHFCDDENATCRFSPEDLICVLQRKDLMPSSLSNLLNDEEDDSSKTELLAQPECFRTNVSDNSGELAAAPVSSENMAASSADRSVDSMKKKIKSSKSRSTEVKIVHAKTVALEQPQFIDGKLVFSDSMKEMLEDVHESAESHVEYSKLNASLKAEGKDIFKGDIFPELGKSDEKAKPAEDPKLKGNVSIRKDVTTGEFAAPKRSGKANKIVIAIILLLLAAGLYFLRYYYGELW